MKLHFIQMIIYVIAFTALQLQIPRIYCFRVQDRVKKYKWTIYRPPTIVIMSWSHFVQLKNRIKFVNDRDSKPSVYRSKVIRICRFQTGEKRKQCVARLVRSFKPDAFKDNTSVGNKTKNTIKQDEKRVNQAGTKRKRAPYAGNVPRDTSRFKDKTSFGNITTNAIKQDERRFNKAGTKRKGTSYYAVNVSRGISTFKDKTSVGNITTNAIKQDETRVNKGGTKRKRTPYAGNVSLGTSTDSVLCRKREFGFPRDTTASIVDLATNMICALCQAQMDLDCVDRWCFIDTG